MTNRKPIVDPIEHPEYYANMNRGRAVMVYIIKRILRAHIDRSKYPMEKEERVDENIYKTWDEANAVAQGLEKKDPVYLYSPHSTFINTNMPEVPKDIEAIEEPEPTETIEAPEPTGEAIEDPKAPEAPIDTYLTLKTAKKAKEKAAMHLYNAKKRGLAGDKLQKYIDADKAARAEYEAAKKAAGSKKK